MGKAKGKNAFWYFMIDKQQELRRNGQNYQVNDPRLQQIAGDEWKELSKEDREPYERKAKFDKERAKNQQIQVQPRTYQQRQSNSFASLVSRESTQLDEEEAKQEYYDQLIESCVKACQSRDDLLNASFFVLGSNVMVRTDENQWPPLELGICQYSIQNGIQYTYHEFIDAGRVPLGYMHHSKEHANLSHKIPLEDFSLASNNYVKIVEDINTILENSRFTNEITDRPTPMMVFCREDALEQNRGIFRWLEEQYNKTYSHVKLDIEVLDLSTLVFNILNALGYRQPIAIIEDKLNSSAFDYSANTLCEFHEEQDNKNCAKGLARCLCYLMSQIFCPVLDITPTENHLPPKREVISDTYTAVLSEVQPMPTNRYYHSNQRPDTDHDDWQPRAETPRDDSDRASVSTGIGRGRTSWGQTSR